MPDRLVKMSMWKGILKDVLGMTTYATIRDPDTGRDNLKSIRIRGAKDKIGFVATNGHQFVSLELDLVKVGVEGEEMPEVLLNYRDAIRIVDFLERSVVGLESADITFNLGDPEVDLKERKASLSISMNGRSLQVPLAYEPAYPSVADITAKAKSIPVSVCFNAKYLMEMCQHIGADDIKLCIDKEAGSLTQVTLLPSGVRKNDSIDALCILMPVRLPGEVPI